MQQSIDVALRLFDLSELPLVQICLFGLLGQREQPIRALPRLHVHLMTQRLAFNEVQEVRRAIDVPLALEETATVTIRNWDFAVPYDLRAPLLNLALEMSTGRYFMFLDSIEQIRPGGLAALFERLVTTDNVAATGGIALQQMIWWDNAFLPLGPAEVGRDLIPGPLFLLDRYRTNNMPQFVAGDPLGERSGFISRLRKDHALDDALLEETMCIRQLVD